MTRRPSYTTIAALVVCGLLAGARQAIAAPDTYLAHARMSGDITTAPSVEVTFVVTRYTTDAEHKAATAALQQSSDDLLALFKNTPDVGQIVVNGKTIPLKYAYRRPQSNGRMVVLIADMPAAFLNPGESGKSMAGHDFTLAVLDFSEPGYPTGELDPAVKLAINAQGLLFTDEYSATVLRLTDVAKK